MYRVEDRVYTFFDVEGLYSWQSEKHLREGKYKADRFFLLEQNYGRGIHVSKQDTLRIQPFSQDALSAFYYVRTLPLHVGDEIEIPNFENGKLYDIIVKVLRKETVKVPAGVFDTIVIEPLLPSEGIFKHKGRIQVWVTDDVRHMPVKMTSKIIIGAIGANLTNSEGVKLADAE